MLNPYDQVVDDLYIQNSSVATYIKDITKKMRAQAKQLIFLNESAEKLFNQKIVNINESHVIYDNISKKQLFNISGEIEEALKKIKFGQDISIKTSNSYDGLAKSSYKPVIENRSIILQNPVITINPNEFILLQEGSFFYVLQKLGLWPKSSILDKYLLAAILHEFAHVKYWPRHGLERVIYLGSQVSQVEEYEADWYWARKNKKFASLLEKLVLRLKQVFNSPTDTYPSDKDRYKNLKEIRRLKEAESRWIWGPKGYEKYGDPAYEKAFIKWSEKQS